MTTKYTHPISYHTGWSSLLTPGCDLPREPGDPHLAGLKAWAGSGTWSPPELAPDPGTCAAPGGPAVRGTPHHTQVSHGFKRDGPYAVDETKSY